MLSRLPNKRICVMLLGLVLIAGITLLAISCGDPGPDENTNKVTVISEAKNASGGGDYRKDDAVNIYAGTVSGKRFKEWTSDDLILEAADKTKNRYSFTMPNRDITITAVFTGQSFTEPSIIPLDISPVPNNSSQWQITGEDWNMIKTLRSGEAAVKVYFYMENAFDRWDAGWVNNSGGANNFGENHKTKVNKMIYPAPPARPYWTIEVPVEEAIKGANNAGQYFLISFNRAMRVFGVHAELVIGDGGSDTPYAGDPSYYSVSGSYTKPAPENPDFHVYLAIGQSNMSGDNYAKVIPPDFKTGGANFLTGDGFVFLNTMAPDRLNGTKGEWKTANPPTFMTELGALNPCDNFGRVLLSKTSGIRIGTINCAVSGAQLQVYDKEWYAQYLIDLASNNPGMWQLAWPHAMGYPYKALVEWGREAQKLGVVKGVIMMHGEAGSGDRDYKTVIERLYNNLVADLDLSGDEFHFVAGTPRTTNKGGADPGMGLNSAGVLKQLDTEYGWFHVIDLESFNDNNTYIDTTKDASHFTAAGHIEAGRLLAEKMYALVYDR